MAISETEIEMLAFMSTDLLNARRDMMAGHFETSKALVREVYSACYDILTQGFEMEEAYP